MALAPPPHVASLVKRAPRTLPVHDADPARARAHSAVNSKADFDNPMLVGHALNDDVKAALKDSPLDRTRAARALKAPRGTSSLVSRAGLPAVDLQGLLRWRDLFAIAVEKCLEHQPGSREWLFDTIND